MTAFNRDDFEYSGGYLMYTGDCGLFTKYYEEPCHPTRLGNPKPEFIARFKYCGKDKARFLTFLIKNFTVEGYLAAREAGYSPVEILESKGHVSTTSRKMMKDAGYTSFSVADYRDYFTKRVSTTGETAEFFAAKDKVSATILGIVA